MMKSLWIAPVLALTTLTAAASAVAQGYGAPPPPPRYQDGGPGGWDAPPSEFREAQRNGFHDGVEGARKDFENHRPPNVRNRDEFRRPNVPGPDRRDYRMGFKRGYKVAVSHMYGPPRVR